MNHTAQYNYREQVFFRSSCLESSPRPTAPTHVSFSTETCLSNRAQFQLHQLKQKLLHIALEEANEVGLIKRVCGAANQAAEMAWSVPCPLLVFPCLFEELVQIARERFVNGSDLEL